MPLAPSMLSLLSYVPVPVCLSSSGCVCLSFCIVDWASTWSLIFPFSFSTCLQPACSPVTMGTGRMAPQPLTKKVSHDTLLHLFPVSQPFGQG